MNVVLTSQQTTLVKSLIKNGDYNNQSEVIRDALRNLPGPQRDTTCAQLADALEASQLSEADGKAFAADVAHYIKRSNERPKR